MDAARLFEPFRCKSLTLPNRIVMAPMTRYFAPGGVPTGDMAAYYRRRAEGNVGLIITEGTGIDRPTARNNPNIPAFHGAEALEGWRRVVDGVHDAGGRIAPQLWHVGAAPDSTGTYSRAAHVESPSARFAPADPAGLAMDDASIAATIDAFVAAARSAKTLGFDCLEFHGAHGYLFDLFFWPLTNIRTDRYGGDWVARTRFAVEIVRAVRAAVGEDFVLLMRISQWKQQDYDARVAHDPGELERWLTPIADAGIDIFHCSQRRFWEPEFAGSDLNFAGWTKKVTGKPTITVGSVGLDGEFMEGLTHDISAPPASLDAVLERLDRGEFDLVAVGRALLSDPDWAEKIRGNRLDELRPFHREHVATLY